MKSAIILLLSFILLFLSCKKENGTVTFYTTASGSWSLVLLGTDRGVLKVPTIDLPECGESGYITINLPPGSHSYYAKNNSGFASGVEKSVYVTEGICKIQNVTP